MKILSLRLKNLNSLVGEWSIDFTAPQYVCDGIFLISGPTGAGKTTILDAICLALYGRTPRQKSFSDSVNEMLPRGRRDCLAEVTFETAQGRFRSLWSHARTGANSRKPFQTPKFCLENADDGSVLGVNTEGKREIVRLIGMEFEQFTRSMLLAQGNFAAFLQSKPGERAEILEQITGAEIYSRISSAVFDLEKARREEIERRKAEMEDIGLLSEEELEELRGEGEECERREAECRRMLELQRERVDWKRKVARLEGERRRLEEDEKRLLEEEAAFVPLREKLAAAERAARIEPAWALLDACRRDLAKTRGDVASLEKARRELEKARVATAENSRAAASMRAEAEKALNDAREKLGRAKILDARLADRRKALEDAQKAFKAASRNLAACRSNAASAAEELRKAGDRRAEVAGWLLANMGDEKIAEKLELLERDASDLAALLAEAKEAEKKQDKAREESLAAQKRIEEISARLGDFAGREKALRERLDARRAALAAVLDGEDIDGLRAALERLRDERREILAFRAADAQEMRRRLTDGAPCPVCGSVHHPFAGGAIPEAGEIEARIAACENRLREAGDASRSASECEQALMALAGEGFSLQGELRKAEADFKIASVRVCNLAADAARREERIRRLREGCERAFRGFGIAESADAQAGVGILRLRSRRFKDTSAELAKLDNEIGALQARQGEDERKAKFQEDTLAQLTAQGKELRSECDELSENRRREFGDLDDAAVKGMAAAWERAKESEEAAREADAQADKNCAARGAELASLRERLEQMEREELERGENFARELLRENFAGEEDFARARLERDEQARLRAKDGDLRRRRLEQDAAARGCEEALQKERARALSPLALQELERGLEELEAAQEKNRERAGSIKERLQANERNKEKIGAKKEELEKLKRDHLVYAELNALIGQKSGEKFRQFAQGLTFEILVGRANRQLEKMSGRYLLALDERKPLELNIIDNYLAGESRSASNLSGGESFIVSLALALGLADMGSRKAPVDSLFLDEGFGTLDEKSLEAILATLEYLRRDGKLIGVISHVGALRERISARIDVVSSAGRSALEGPGCARLA